jgi:hypothetical protein
MFVLLVLPKPEDLRYIGCGALRFCGMMSVLGNVCSVYGGLLLGRWVLPLGSSLLHTFVSWFLKRGCEMTCQQDRQCTYDVTLTVIRESFLRKSNKYYACVCVSVYARARACSFAYPACNAYAPYCDVIYGPSGSTIFFDIIFINGAIFRKKLWALKCVFWFSL